MRRQDNNNLIKTTCSGVALSKHKLELITSGQPEKYSEFLLYQSSSFFLRRIYYLFVSKAIWYRLTVHDSCVMSHCIKYLCYSKWIDSHYEKPSNPK